MLTNVPWPTVTRMVKPRVGRRVRNLGGMADWGTESGCKRQWRRAGSYKVASGGVYRCSDLYITREGRG